MAIVLLSCADCGPIDVDARDVVLETIRKVYQFTCPNCSKPNRESAAASVVELLVRAGVRIRPWPMKGDDDGPVQTQSDPVERSGP